jgi:hypothetical protein
MQELEMNGHPTVTRISYLAHEFIDQLFSGQDNDVMAYVFL